MITIITDTRPEYDEMMEYATSYICRLVPYSEHKKHSGKCLDCYKDNYLKCGIRVIEPEIIPVDKPEPNEI